jgi:6-phosphogluconolactonase
MDRSVIQNAKVFRDVDELARAAAEESLRIADVAVSERDRCSIALAGGQTPAPLYALWSEQYQERMPWDRIHLFWSDERYVPPEDESSNYRMARENLIARVAIPPGNIHPMPTYFDEPDEAAHAYEATLRKFFGTEPPSFDLQLLGAGPEGHTASLFPGSPALQEQVRWVVAVRAPVEPPLRLSLTLPVLNQARNTFFIATGARKREIMRAVREESDSAASRYPVGMIRPAGRAVWFLDQAANGA